MPTLADQIRAILGDFNADDLDAAVRAVLDKCQAVRNEWIENGTTGHRLADEFETVIARELGIES